LNRYGLEVTSGIILGLDTDTSDSEGRLKAFIDLSFYSAHGRAAMAYTLEGVPALAEVERTLWSHGRQSLFVSTRPSK
jgi:hypothetical protein